MALSSGAHNVTDRLGTLFYPLTIAAVVGILISVQTQLGAEFAVFGLYALAGLAGGAAVYYGTRDATERTTRRIDERLHRTTVYVACASTVALVALTGTALLVVGGLVVGYALVVRQLFADVSPQRILPQITAVFLLSPVTKYLTSGLYVGHGDLLYHTRLVEDVMLTGSLRGIAEASYYDFPGLHLIAGTVGSISGLGAADGLLLTGIAAYAVVIPAVYLVVVRLTANQSLALYTAFGVAVLDGLSFYASYVFPQSIATVMIVVLAVLASLASRDGIKWAVTGAFVLVAIALSLTHHLTQVLFVPVVGLGLLLYAIRDREHARTALLSREMALVALAGIVTAVRLVQTGFLDRIVANAALMLQGGPRGGYTQSVSLGFGRPADPRSVGTALEWLVSPYGVYLVLLLLVFSIGIVAFLRVTDRPVAQSALFWTGVVGAVLVFETPISIQSLVRIKSPWLFAFAFVVGIGLLQLRRRTGSGRASLALMAVIVALAATAPVVTADNYYDLDPRPTVQTSFSEQEYAELRAVSSYVGEREGSVTAFWLTRQTFERFRVDDVSTGRLEGRTLHLPAGQFIYRSRWPGKQVHFAAGQGEDLYANSLYVSDRWLDRRVAGGNMVYTAGGTGVMWSATERPFEDV